MEPGRISVAKAADVISSQGVSLPIDFYAALVWIAAGLRPRLSIANGGLSIRVSDFQTPLSVP